jgi:hypothetical protein
MPKNVFAYTGLGFPNPQFLSINEVEGELEFTVRTEGAQSPACMMLPVAELDGLLFALVSWQVRDREKRVNCPPL